MDDDGATIIPNSEIHRQIYFWRPFIQYITDWRRGMFMVSQKDYLRQPVKLKECIIIHDSFLSELRNKNSNV